MSYIYNQSMSLLTDLYQLTMAYGYYQQGRTEEEASFSLFFRKNPFGGGYAIAAGMGTVIEFLDRFSFDDSDIDYLRSLTGNDSKPLFNEDFLDYLKGMKFECTVDAIAEGTVVFPHEPLMRVTGPLIQCQLLETVLLNTINFQTLIATKARRISHAADGDPVLEFGLRRAQGWDGSISASRAAVIGGCTATSNVLAGKLFGIPVKGTHAHSWVMSYEDEFESFQKYAEVMPNNCVFLVDTYNTIKGVKKAVKVGEWLRERGHEMVGVRLDSGDLAELSIKAREILDKAGFPNASIVASNDLNENLIFSLKLQGAKIGVWGVGTQLATGGTQAALGGVYKISALRKDSESPWVEKVKLSEQAIKVSNPGLLKVRRFFKEVDGKKVCVGDVLYDERDGLGTLIEAIDPIDFTKRVQINTEELDSSELLTTYYKNGVKVAWVSEVTVSRTFCEGSFEQFPSAMKRFDNPTPYFVGLEEKVFNRKVELIRKNKTVTLGEEL